MAILSTDLVAITLTDIWNSSSEEKWWRETGGVPASVIRQDTDDDIFVYAYRYVGGSDPLLSVHVEIPQLTAEIERDAGEIVYEETDGTELLRFDFPTYTSDIVSPGYTSPDQSAETMATFLAYGGDLVFRVTRGDTKAGETAGFADRGVAAFAYNTARGDEAGIAEEVAIVQSHALIVTEALGIGDAGSQGIIYEVPAAEVLGIGDAGESELFHGVVVEEGLGVSEARAPVYAFAPAIAEALGIGDRESQLRFLVENEGLGIAEAIAIEYTDVVIREGIGFSDIGGLVRRDEQSLKIRRWADMGDRIEIEQTDPPLDRAEGYTLIYSQPGGPLVERPTMNQLFREITGMLVELNSGGSMPEWSDRVDYEHVAFVRYAGSIYVSTRSSGPGNGGPVEPGTNTAFWRTY